jgi:dihydrofolate synthase / folylpolyglutamate synthase
MAVGTDSGMEWLRSLNRFGIKPGLNRTRKVLQAFGNPQDALIFFHVAGTNGKGSVCAYLTSLMSVTKDVGTFTSPAFDGYRGRFSVNGKPIEVTDFEVLAMRVREVVAMETPDDPLTEFEVLTVMAILHFQAQRVDVVIWETGLGGRYDSTNVVNPWVTAITNVGYDHVEVLGPTLRDIAYDKAGILKPGVPHVTAAQGEALEVIREVARQTQSPLIEMGGDFQGTRWFHSDGTQSITFRGQSKDAYDIPVPLFGGHQCTNAAVALAVYEAACLRGGFEWLSNRQLRSAMGSTVWTGRFEVLWSRGLSIVLDGAHNPDGARALASALEDFQSLKSKPRCGWTMVIGILKDKQIGEMLFPLLPYAERVIVAQPDNPRAINAEELSKMIKACRNNIDVRVVSSVDDALHSALPYEDDICCWGSLYTVHEARNAIAQSTEFWK